MRQFGLISRRGQGPAIPLRGVEIGGEVTLSQARISLRQRYRSEEADPVEAIYTFPVPGDAVLTGFAMTVGERRVEGVVKEREEAFRTYDDALLEGHGAALLDQERQNIFTAQVGNLLPGEEIIIEIEYIQRLLAEEGALRLCVPTVVAPRYIPGVPQGSRTGHGLADPTDAVPDADRISPPLFRGTSSYSLKLALLLRLGEGIAVESPSHRVAIHREEGGLRVGFAAKEEALDRDLVLQIRAVEAPLLAGLSCHRRGPDEGVFALTVVPDLYTGGAERKGREVVFLIDTSGSMGGTSMDEAKGALRLCLRHLQAGDRFNIVAFASSHHGFSVGLTPFTDASLKAADRWVAGLRAAGGTEMLAPLLEAMKSLQDGILVLLTDGQVGNEDEVLREVLGARRGTRVYTFGIGMAPSDLLLRELAKRTSGGVEFIHPGEKIDEKVTSTFARATAERVTAVKVSFGEAAVQELAPITLPDLVDGEVWSLMGRYGKAEEGRVRMEGVRNGEPWSLEIPFHFPEEANNPLLLRSWAAEKVRDLEAFAVTGRREEVMKDRIVALAVAHGLASRYTSFVLVETRTGARNVPGMPATRVVPVSAPAGWVVPQALGRAGEISFDAIASYPTRERAGTLDQVRLMMRGNPDIHRSPSPQSPSRPFGAPSPVRASPSKSPPKAPLRGLLEKARMALTSPMASREKAEKKEGESSHPDRAAALPPSRRPVETPESILALQLASGLWEEEGKDGGGVGERLRATAQALLALHRLGITTSHPVHGVPVRKAVEAVLEVISQDLSPWEKRALLAAWLVAGGKRTRGEVEARLKNRGIPAEGEPVLEEESVAEWLGREVG